jgi:AcrR family transcriptional regulator
MTDAGTTTETREQLLDAAETCFARAHVANTTLDDVAAEAGVDLTTLSRHFSSSEELLTEVLLRVWVRESAVLTEVLAVQANLRAKVIEGLTFFVTRIAETPYLLALVRDELTVDWGSAGGSKLLVAAIEAFLRPYFAGQGPALRADIDDTIEWLLRQVLLLLTVTPHRGLTAAEIRYQVRTFIVPSVLRETPEI